MKLSKLQTFICAFSGLFLYGCNVNYTSEIKETQEQGDKIVAAIYKYKEKSGTLPMTLAELTTEYIDEIKAPTYGEKKWDYVYKYGSQEFVLYFWGKKSYDVGYGFFSSKGKWLRIENSF